jgi:plastocyanin
VRLGVLGVLAATSLTACGGGSQPAGPPQTYAITVDGYSTDSPVAVNGYFPKVLRIHPGDTVVFHPQFSGLPHTVALGRAVDTAMRRLDKLAAEDPAALSNGPPPEYAALPRLLPSGAADANQTAAQPCAVAGKATIPSGQACPRRSIQEYDGTQSLVTSGWFGQNQDWSLTFSKKTKPATYRFLCQVHGPDMSGTVQVVKPATGIKDPAAVSAEGRALLEAAVQRVRPGFAALGTATSAHPLAGSGDPSAPGVLIAAFGPKQVTVPVGGSVSWTFIGTHSIAFNAPPEARGLRRVDADGSVHVSAPAQQPAGGPGAGPGERQLPPVIDGGSWDGTGFRSSGIVFGPPPPNATQFRLRFTKAGSYAFVCTVHVGMTGTVTVR